MSDTGKSQQRSSPASKPVVAGDEQDSNRRSSNSTGKKPQKPTPPVPVAHSPTAAAAKRHSRCCFCSFDCLLMTALGAAVVLLATLALANYVAAVNRIRVGSAGQFMLRHVVDVARQNHPSSSSSQDSWIASALDWLASTEYVMNAPRRPSKAPPTRDAATGARLCESTHRPLPEIHSADDATLMSYATDPSYTRYEDSSIFFRPLPRRVPISPVSGAPELQVLYMHYGNDRQGKSGHAKSILERERTAYEAHVRKRLAATGRTATLTPRRARATDEFSKEVYGMAEIDPVTNTLRNITTTTATGGDGVMDGGGTNTTTAQAINIPCYRAGLVMHLQWVTFTIRDGVVLENTYDQIDGDPFTPEAVSAINMPPCLRRVISLMCTGDKWEVICPRDMLTPHTRPSDYSLSIRVDVKDVGGQPAGTLADADAAMARAVFIPPQVGDETALGDGSTTPPPPPRLFSRAMFFERARLSPPRRLGNFFGIGSTRY